MGECGSGCVSRHWKSSSKVVVSVYTCVRPGVGIEALMVVTAR